MSYFAYSVSMPRATSIIQRCRINVNNMQIVSGDVVDMNSPLSNECSTLDVVMLIMI